MSSKLSDVLKKMNKEYGANTVMILGEVEPQKINCYSTGSLMIDKILGSGIARGRISEIWGNESSGKTTLALQVAAQCQKEGDNVMIIDVEQALDLGYAKKLGVDINKLIFSQPTTAEQALDIICRAAETGEVGLIILDSIGALCPQAEIDGEMGDMNIGLVARLMSKFCRKITPILGTTNCALICINQVRMKINTGFMMGNPETTTGGNALKFFASQRIELKKTTAIKEGQDVIGTNVKIKIAKNKISQPMQVAEVPLIFGKGFDASNEALDLALSYDICHQSGAFYTAHDGTRFQGKAKLREYYFDEIKSNELRELVKQKLSGITLDPVYEVNPETGEVIE